MTKPQRKESTTDGSRDQRLLQNGFLAGLAGDNPRAYCPFCERYWVDPEHGTDVLGPHGLLFSPRYPGYNGGVLEGD